MTMRKKSSIKSQDLKRYRVMAEVTISISTVVFARDKRHAVALAHDQPMPSIHEDHFADHEDSWLTSGELDGTPKKLTAEEEEEE